MSFQYHVVDLFEKMGYKKIRVDDFISAQYEDEKTGILCVDSTLVDYSTLVNFYSQLRTNDYTHGFVFTSGLFTREAIKYPDEIAENINLTLVDGVGIKIFEEKLKDKPHSFRYKFIWSFKKLLDIIWFSALVWVSYGVFLECRLDRHYWIVVDILNGIFGGVFFIYPLSLYRQDLLKMIYGWMTYLFILCILCMSTLIFSG
jgi:hypothetical protein